MQLHPQLERAHITNPTPAHLHIIEAYDSLRADLTAERDNLIAEMPHKRLEIMDAYCEHLERFISETQERLRAIPPLQTDRDGG